MLHFVTRRMHKTSKSLTDTGTTSLQLRIHLVWYSHARLNCVSIHDAIDRQIGRVCTAKATMTVFMHY